MTRCGVIESLTSIDNFYPWRLRNFTSRQNVLPLAGRNDRPRTHPRTLAIFLDIVQNNDWPAVLVVTTRLYFVPPDPESLLNTRLHCKEQHDD